MAFDLNNPPNYLEDEVIPDAADGEGGPSADGGGGPSMMAAGGVRDLNTSHVEEEEGAPGSGDAHGGPGEGTGANSFDLNMEPDLDQEEVQSGNVGIAQSSASARTRLVISNEQRNEVYRALLAASINGKLKKTSTRTIATTFGVHKLTVQRIWEDAKKQVAEGLVANVDSKKANRVGPKKIDIDCSILPSIALHKRSNLRSLAHQLHVSVSTLHRRFKLGIIRRHSNTLKPFLKVENKKRFCLSMLDQSTVSTQPKLKDMKNIVHIDEKWFSVTKKKKTFYLLPDEEDPHRTVQNKNCIGKLMFLGVLEQPIHDEQGNEIFSGNFGIFPFVKEEPAARSSRNRPKGTLIKKKYVIANRDVMREYMITKVLPAIKAHCPEKFAGETIYIQQDNAHTHVSPTDPEFVAAVEEIGLDIRLMQQPPNSPDMNILDLSFFSSIQSLTDQRTPRTLQELIEAVEEEYNGYDVSKVKKVFLTLQACMIETMKCGGNNRYKQPHMNKDRSERLGILPSQLSCETSLIESVMEILGGTT